MSPSHRRATTLTTVALAGLGLLSGCGSSAARGAPARSATATSAPAATAPAARILTTPASVRSGPFRCRAVVTQTLDGVAQRVLAQTASGRNVSDAVLRLSRSKALGAAVARGDAAAAMAALEPLLKHQIVRLELYHDGQTVLRYGTTTAFGTGTGTLPGGGTFAVSTAAANGIDGLLGSLTGAQVVVQGAHGTVDSTLTGSARGLARRTSWAHDGTAYRVTRIPAVAFPSRPVQLALLQPASTPVTCAHTRERTVADVDLAVARQLFMSEARGRHARAVLRYVSGDPRFAAAVAHDDAAGVRTAIVRFFRTRRLHVVRIHAVDAAGKLVNDVGGPYVLAPITGPVHDAAGRVVGEVTLAAQDDTGFVKLLSRFTGAAVQLATTAGEVPGGSLPNAPADLADHGTVRLDGHRYVATGFTATAFPSGPLRVRLLLG